MALLKTSRHRRFPPYAIALIAAICCGAPDDVLARSTVVVVLDDSGSMDELMRSSPRVKKIRAAKDALVTVLEQLTPDSRVGVVLLNGSRQGSPWLIPLGPVKFAEARRAIQDVSAWGGTPLGEFMKTAADALLLARSKDFYGEYRLLVVTDGEATDPDVLAAYLPDIMSRGLTVDVIGVDMRGNHSLATQVDSYRRADDPTSLTRAIREVFAETSADANDTGGTDFELLEGLPDDFAAAALTALAQSGNEPIGQRTTADVPVDAQGVPPANILVPPGRQPPAAPENRRQLPFFVLIIVIFVVLRIVAAARRTRR